MPVFTYRAVDPVGKGTRGRLSGATPAASAGRVSKVARTKGMRLLHEDGLRLIRAGLTTPAEVLRVANA